MHTQSPTQSNTKQCSAKGDAGPMVNKHNVMPKGIPALRSFQHHAIGMQAQWYYGIP